jgi:Ser/Thr protein kinase RdoA (MazF antagonist)
MHDRTIRRRLPVMPQQRAKVTSEELAMVLSHYDLGIVTGVRGFPRGAHAAAKAVVTTDRGRFLLKRRSKDKSHPDKVQFAHELQRFLASRNFPLAHLIETREGGQTMLRIGDAVYEVFEFIDGRPYDGGLIATYEAGRALGLYHKLAREYHTTYDPPRGHYHNSKTVTDAFAPLAENLSKKTSPYGTAAEVPRLLADLREAYEAAAMAADKAGVLGWETQIVHADWHPGNLLFQDQHVVAVLDYDVARIRQRVMDVANGCLQFSLVTGDRDLRTWPDRTDHLRARRFLRGYDEVDVLSEGELRVTPFLMQEVLIAQAIPPILQTGTFAGLDAFAFLRVMLKKVRWLQQNSSLLKLDTPEE